LTPSQGTPEYAKIRCFPGPNLRSRRSGIEKTRRWREYPSLRACKIIRMRPLYSLIITLALSGLILLVGSKIQAKERSESPSQPETTPAAIGNLDFCTKMQVSRTGAICESRYGLTARLDFPQVDVDSVLAGEQFFPHTESTFSADDQAIQGQHYRNITFVLRWEPTTPDFLQAYLTDILPRWEGKGIPYRLLWRASYETCTAWKCKTCTEIKAGGEVLPHNILELPEDLAADSNFNGVPASFWNTNLTVK
jgi:hypothetical protein